MSLFEKASVVLALISLCISIVAIFISGKANSLNKRMFQRQGIIDLHMAWQGVNNISATNLITTDIVKAANALALTSSLWNHDVIEKTILYQTYWEPYRQLYDQMYGLDKLIPGQSRTVKSLMTSEITKAYKGMQDFESKSVITTKL